MADEKPWTRESLLAAIDRTIADLTDEDAGPRDSDRWMLVMLMRSGVLLKVAARFLREE